MSYVARDDRPADKTARYAELEDEILAVLEGEPNLTARMATVSTMLADAFPGHIACDSRSASEIVVPVFDAAGDLIAVFDVDATETAAFDAVDAAALERLLGRVFAA